MEYPNKKHKRLEVDDVALTVTEVARTALKDIVCKRMLPLPHVYEEVFWNVVKKNGYDDLMSQMHLPSMPPSMVEEFLQQTEEVLDGVQVTMDSFFTGTKDHIAGISDTIEGIEGEFPTDSEMGRKIKMLIHHNQSLQREAAQAQEKLRDQASVIQDLRQKLRIDPLTELLNRRALEADLKKELARSRRYSFPLSVIMADIDFFKKINDSLGHRVGDRVLQKLAEILKKGVREVDLLYRYGGEEFVIILPHTPCKAAAHLAERLRQKIKKYVFTIPKENTKFSVTVSFGVTAVRDGDDIDGVLSRADSALYEAKSQGRDKVTAACLD